MAETVSTPRRGWSVRSRILVSILVVAALGMAGAGITSYLVDRTRTIASIDVRLLSRVDAARFVITGERATGPGPAGSPTAGPTPSPSPGASDPSPEAFTSTRQALQAILARVIPATNESALGIIDGEATYEPGVDLSFHLDRSSGFVARVVKETTGGKVSLGTLTSPSGTYRYVAVPVTVTGDAESGIYVAAIDVNAELEEISAAFSTYALVALAALLAIGLVGWFVAGRLLRPIRRLTAAASRITASERNERIPVDGADDVSALTATINGMLDRLDTALTGQRQLLDDVRHELKTPLTIVRGHLELLDAGNPDDVRATRDLVVDELDRMTLLVDDIEALAESQRAPTAAVPTDVADFTLEVFAKVQGIPGHEWQLVEAAQAILPMDAPRITQAWLQLADNAAKYSPAGSPIELGSTHAGGSVEFWVSDHGPGIPAGSEQRIFERFGRVDAGRGIRGSGLGLAIVTAIAKANGGRVSLRTSPNGSRFGIVIPENPARESNEGHP